MKTKVLIKCLITLLWLIFSTASPSPSTPPTAEPVIYVTFPRWENRTFSPRIYYLMLQKHGLTEKLLDLNNEYYKYLTETELRPQNPPVNIVFKSKPKKTTDKPPSSEVADRSAFRILSRKKGLLHLRTKDDPFGGSITLVDIKDPGYQSSPVVFPSASPIPVSNFFEDRIAYPGLSSRKGSIGNGPSQLVSSEVFERSNKSRAAMNFTSDDMVDTVSLLVDIIQHSNWDNENAVLSPFSITNILSLLFLGSNGMTYDELGNHLNRANPLNSAEYSSRELKFHTAFRRLLHFLDQGSTQNVVVSICNRILVDRKYPLLDSYRQDAIHFYNAQSDAFDFGTQSEEVMNNVNSWVSYKTKGKIRSIIDSPPSSETTLMLLNAVYFRGDWEIPFIKELNQRKSFHVTPRETLEVTMMTNLLNVPYLETEHFRATGIPYKGKGVGLFVLLPTNPGVKGLKEMERQLTRENLKRFNSMQLSQVTLQIPKMRMESQANIKDLLLNFGLGSMFSPQTANFSRMSDTRGLYVSSVLHKCIFEMNEDGVSAAAVTIATGDRTLDDRPIQFTVNRPFAFIIMNIKAKTVLFYGRVTRPLPLEDN